MSPLLLLIFFIPMKSWILTKFESFCFQDLQESEGTEPSDWERYAQEEYDLLVAEEGANEQTEG